MKALPLFAVAGLCSIITLISARALARPLPNLLVRFRPEIRTLLPSGTICEQLAALPSLLGLPRGVELVEPPIARLLGGTRHPELSHKTPALHLDSFFYLRLSPDAPAREVLPWLEAHPLVEYAEEDGFNAGAAAAAGEIGLTNQWHHWNVQKPRASIQTPRAWEITRGSTNVLVAVLDTGLAELPEFSGRVLPGYNFVADSPDTLDDHGHGTQVTGLLAASAGSESGIAGVDQRCRILPVKVLDASNQGMFSWEAQGIDYAVSQGCKVINFSIATGAFNRTLQRAITNAIARGVIFVTVAGNDGRPGLSFPGYLTPCLTVGATDREDRVPAFSNSGPQLDLVAPGVDLATVGLAGRLEWVRGTSFAAPLVSGVCALLASVRPGLTQDEARLLLCAGAEDLAGGSADAPGFDETHGWGRLNAFNTLLLATIRLHLITRSDGLTTLSWTGPPATAQRAIFSVEQTSDLEGEWSRVSSGDVFQNVQERVFWSETDRPANGANQVRFFRVKLTSF